jgi:hypothetical protein
LSCSSSRTPHTPDGSIDHPLEAVLILKQLVQLLLVLLGEWSTKSLLHVDHLHYRVGRLINNNEILMVLGGPSITTRLQ